jgi:hypothetical protein
VKSLPTTLLLVVAVCVAVAFIHATPVRASLAADSLASLGRLPPTDSFTFVVWGDNRCRAGALGSAEFPRIIRESNALRPVFTIGVGDLIPGADDDDAEWTRAQWTDFLNGVKRFDMPCLPVPGNHDLDGAKSNAMYEQLIGPRRYSLDFGGSRFIVLDSQEAFDANSPQFGWLGEQLAKPPRPRNAFLFLHAPLFFSDAWEPIHLLLRRFPVRAVFAGHEHLYCYDERDGIKYVVTGGAGAPLRDPPERGGFYHYVIANLRGDEFSVAVARDGAILPAECVLHGDFPLIDQVLGSVQAPQIDVPAGESAVVAGAATIRNPGKSIWEGAARWRAGGGWVVEPAAVRFSLAPGEEMDLPFTINVPGPLAARYPPPELTFDYPATGSRTLPFVRPLRLRNLLPCPRVNTGGVIAVPVSITPPDFVQLDPQDLSATVGLRWDADALRVAIDVRDDIACHKNSGEDLWEGDSVELFFDMADDGNEKAHQGDDHDICAARGAKGIEVWRYGGPAGYAEGAARDIVCKIERKTGGRTYSLTIPWAELKPFKPRSRASFGFSMVVNDDDGLDHGGLSWVELTPGAGTGRTPFPLDRVVLQ